MRQPYSSKLEIPVPVPVSFEVEGVPGRADGWIARLSVAGVDIDTLHRAPVGSKIVLHAALDPDSSGVQTFTGLVRWVAGSRIGVQFAELGARETHGIIEAMRGATGERGPESEVLGRPVRGLAQSRVNLTSTASDELEVPITIEEEG